MKAGLSTPHWSQAGPRRRSSGVVPGAEQQTRQGAGACGAYPIRTGVRHNLTSYTSKSKSALRCSQTIPIRFSSWFLNTNRIKPFVQTRIQPCIYPSCGETVIFEKYSTRWHYIRVHLFPCYCQPANIPISLLFPRMAGAFPKQSRISLAWQTLASLQSYPIRRMSQL